MKHATSTWLSSLDLSSMKKLVCLLFGLRKQLEGEPCYDLYLELIQHLDDEYHWLKGD